MVDLDIKLGVLEQLSAAQERVEKLEAERMELIEYIQLAREFIYSFETLAGHRTDIGDKTRLIMGKFVHGQIVDWKL